MPKFNNVGWIYPKKHYGTAIGSSWEAIAAMIIPPYAICQNYYLTVTAAANNNDNTKLSEQMYWGIKGLYFAIPQDTDFTSDDVPMTYVNKYAPLGIGEWGDGDTTAVDTEFPGHFATSPHTKTMQFFDRERSLHLNDGTSMPSGDNQLTFADQFSTRGNPYKKGMGIKVEDAKMLVFVARGDEPEMSTDWSDAMTGNTAGPQALTQELWKQFGHGSDVDAYPSGMGALDTNVQQYLLNGVRESSVSEGYFTQAQTMYVNAKLSLRIKVVEPATDRHISGG